MFGGGGDQKFPRVGRWKVGCSGFGGRGFDTHGWFLLGIPSSRLTGYCRFRLRLLRPGRLPGCGHFGLFGRLRDRLRELDLCVKWWWLSRHTSLRRRGTTPHPHPSARHRARPAELSERKGGL